MNVALAREEVNEVDRTGFLGSCVRPKDCISHEVTFRIPKCASHIHRFEISASAYHLIVGKRWGLYGGSETRPLKADM